MRNHNKKPKALTMIELLIVVVIIGVIATFAMPAYKKAKEKAVDKEAQTLLRLIKAAEDMYRLESTEYKGCGDTAGCNTLLSLDLPVGPNWVYKVDSSTATTFTGTATGDKGSQGAAGTWTMDQNGDTSPAF